MADDFFGPASDGAVSTRPTLTPQIPLVGSPPSWFAPCSSEDNEDGTQISAEWLNRLVGNLEAVRLAGGIDSSDVTPGDDGVLLAAILALIATGSAVHVGLTDTGTVNAIAADVVPSVSAWADGAVYIFAPGTTTTSTAPTFAPDGLAPKTIVHDDGTALLVGEGLSGAPLVAVYRASIGKLVLIGSSKTYVDKAIAAAQPYAIGLLSPTTIPTSATTMLTIGAPSAASGITLASNRLVIPTAGLYLVTASAGITTTATSGVLSARRRSAADAELAWNVFGLFGADGSGTWGNAAGAYRFSAGELLAFSLIQYSGYTQTTTGGGHYLVKRIGD
jgi:hypothetical protein